jgi:spore maturation protein SpmA
MEDSAIGISIGGNILVGKLLREVSKYASTIAPEAVIASGALNLETLTSSPSVIHGLRQAYGAALSALMICATVIICVSILTTFGMQRLNLVKISKEREAIKQSGQPFCKDETDFRALSP